MERSWINLARAPRAGRTLYARLGPALALFVLIAASGLSPGAHAQAPGSAAGAAAGASPALQAARQKELVVATKEAPPFAMKGPDGHWTGLSIDLWHRIADRLGLHYRLQETDLKGLLDGVAESRFDAGVAAVTITGAREEKLDFSQPFYTSGLGIAVPNGGSEGWWGIVGSIFSLGFMQAILTLAAVLLVVGFLIWLFERRRNEQFGGGTLSGLGNGFWWSAVTMTTVGYGDKAPATLAGRVLAIGWMFCSVIVISSFTAGITTSLTADRLRGAVRRFSDLHDVRVGAIDGSSTVDYLTQQRVATTLYPTARAGLKALTEHRLGAFVYDRPLLAWQVKQEFSTDVTVLPLEFDKQTYGIALPTNSPLREAIDRTLLQEIHGDWWQGELVHYLGRASTEP